MELMIRTGLGESGNLVGPYIISAFDKLDEIVAAINALNGAGDVRIIQAVVFAFGDNVATGDGKHYIPIPAYMDGYTLASAVCRVVAPGATGDTIVQVFNVSKAEDVLSVRMHVESGQTSSHTAQTQAVIDPENQAVLAHDLLRIDVDAVSATPPKGLIVTLTYSAGGN